ncbi:MAG: nitronate monooxygenase [Alphaproteobacteria bacterium]|nr:nitronate monooxygenase [Alphaproteobacteria bacterium]
MALQTRLAKMLGLVHPVIQAPMAGGMTTPELVAAVSNAGGLGSFAAATTSPAAIRTHIAAIRAKTDKPFAVNLFVLAPVEPNPSEVAFANALLARYRIELGMETNAAPPAKWAEDFEAQFEAVLDLAPPVFSSTFGAIGARKTAALKARGVLVVGTATNIAEAKLLEAQGVDAVVAQGAEAGGHRGTFVGRAEDSLIGTMALVPQVVDAINIPVIAAGGIMDGRGLAAALALGASAASMGTAFLRAEEAGTHPLHKDALGKIDDTATTVTRAVSGRHARGIRSRYMDEMAPHADEMPAYPVTNALTTTLRAEAAKQGNTGLMVMWAGQGAPMASVKPAAEIVEAASAQAEAILGARQEAK